MAIPNDAVSFIVTPVKDLYALRLPMKEQLKEIPILGSVASFIYGKLTGYPALPLFFPGSEDYWEERYAAGGTSGAGSYGKFAHFKADILNNFVEDQQIGSVIEFGCGDGNQLELAEYPVYTGYDVSETVIEMCRERFSDDPKKRFRLMEDYSDEQAELVLSLDVIYHLTEDDVFHDYMKHLFRASTRYVCIYSSNRKSSAFSAHVRHRQFTDWIRRNTSGWKLMKHIPNRYPYRWHHKSGSFADFYIFKKGFRRKRSISLA